MSVRVHGRAKLSVALAIGLCGQLVLGMATPALARDEPFGPRRQMLALTNRDRARYERHELDFVERLSHYAKRHSARMARRGFIFHSTEEQLRHVLGDYRWSLGGENVGVGGSLESLEDAFMGSRLHRQNILRRVYDHAAVGIVRQDGRIWVTVIFYG
jgi:uncharacterized protein YkwD